jgi:hypothetical protein
MPIAPTSKVIAARPAAAGSASARLDQSRMKRAASRGAPQKQKASNRAPPIARASSLNRPAIRGRFARSAIAVAMVVLPFQPKIRPG